MASRFNVIGEQPKWVHWQLEVSMQSAELMCNNREGQETSSQECLEKIYPFILSQFQELERSTYYFSEW